MGTSDQYELGDLSGKFGTLENSVEYMKAYNDTNLPLYGYETVLGYYTEVKWWRKNEMWILF